MLRYIQVISRSFEQPHPAATLKTFNEPLSLESFISGLGGYSQSFWKALCHDALPHDASWSMIARRLYHQNVRFYELPSKSRAPITHNGKGTGYVFFQGPERLPVEALDGMTMLDSEKAQAVMATVKADASYWKHCLRHAGMVGRYAPIDDGLDALQKKIKAYLASGKLRAYSFPYKPKMSATAKSSPVYEDHAHKPVPLAPESPATPVISNASSKPESPQASAPIPKDVNSIDLDNITHKDIPTFKSGEFNEWFDARTPEELATLYQDKAIRNKISDGLRGDGGKHEFLMVVEAPQWSKWGVSAKEVQEDYAIPIETLNDGGLAKGWKHSTGLKGSKAPGSKKVHNELQKVIQKSTSLESYKANMHDWSEKWINGGYDALPKGFHK